MVIKILIWIRQEWTAVIVATIAARLQIKVQVNHGLLVFGANVFQAPEKQRVRVKGIERTHERPQIAKYGNGDDNKYNYIGAAEYLPGVSAILLQNLIAKLLNVLRSAGAIEVKVVQKRILVKALDDFIGEIVVADGESMRNDVLNRVDAKIAIDTPEHFSALARSSFGGAGKKIAVEQRFNLHVSDEQLKRFAGSQMLDAKRQDAVDTFLLKAPCIAVEKKLEGNEH